MDRAFSPPGEEFPYLGLAAQAGMGRAVGPEERRDRGIMGLIREREPHLATH